MKKHLLVLLLFATMNCDAQWITHTLPQGNVAYRLGFYNSNTGVTSSHNLSGAFPAYFYYTTNSGVNWNVATNPTTLRTTMDFQFINNSLVYACGSENTGINNFSYKAAFLKSTNSGISWTKGSVFDTLTGYMRNIHFFDANTGYALIDSNPSPNTKLYKTTNGGQNWQSVRLIEAGMRLDGMYFFDLNTGFVSGYKQGSGISAEYGVIYKTTNGGLNFIKTSFLWTPEIADFTFLNSTTGLAFGFGNNPAGTIIYRTTNTGTQWDSVSYYPGGGIRNVECLPGTGLVFAAGITTPDSNVVYKIMTMKSTNYGNTWTVNTISQRTDIYGLSMTDANNYFMSGSGNILQYAQILKSTNGGNVFVNQTGTNVPSVFSLAQNYPNPFNPSTNIKFDIPKSSFVKISVFDISGREVEALVNERLQAGTYETSWNGSAFSSGVYFYKITADEYAETKKMIMVK